VDLWINSVHPADHRVLTHSLQTSAPNNPVQSIAMESLDHFLQHLNNRHKISFIKIDVQGYEGNVCKGMNETLKDNPDAVIGLEYSPKGVETLGFDPQDILNFFVERQYLLHVLTRLNGLQYIAREELPAFLETKGYIDLVFSRRKLV
jgi:hypothetical protein